MPSRKGMRSTRGSNDINKYGQLMLRPSVGVTQWLCGGLQIRIRGFDPLSRPHRFFKIIRKGTFIDLSAILFITGDIFLSVLISDPS